MCGCPISQITVEHLENIKMEGDVSRIYFGVATTHQDYIERRVSPEPNTGCWLWIGPISQYGYGKIGKTSKFGRDMQAHRGVYETLVGPIPPGMEIDHKCNCRSCVNPGHLQPVTRQVNAKMIQSRDHKHCRKGHALTAENTYWDKGRGWRQCNTCRAHAQMKAAAKRGSKPRIVRTETHCKHGHEITGANTYVRLRGSTECRLCRSDANARARRKRGAL